MGRRNDLIYEKRETKAPYIYTGAMNIDEALEKALYAILDAQKFREYARATGIDVVKRGLSWGMATGCFACGVAFCAFALWLMGVI